MSEPTAVVKLTLEEWEWLKADLQFLRTTGQQPPRWRNEKDRRIALDILLRLEEAAIDPTPSSY